MSKSPCTPYAQSSDNRDDSINDNNTEDVFGGGCSELTNQGMTMSKYDKKVVKKGLCVLPMNTIKRITVPQNISLTTPIQSITDLAIVTKSESALQGKNAEQQAQGDDGNNK
uniref:Type III pantothenate kinase n=1 Tax=Lygus hesperus TaxID=30085 RepID=A0A0A9VXH0_LYGHE